MALLFRYFLISCASTFFIYWIYFHFLSPIIVSLIQPVSLDDFMPWCRWAIKELGGIKPYVLYSLMFVCLFLAWGADFLFSRFLRWGWILLLPLAWIFFKKVGFFPPMGAPVENFAGVVFVYCVFITTALLAACARQSWWVSPLIVAALLLICMYAASGISRLDYACTLAPAQRLLHGHWFSQTYFLYDYLLAMIAALWMKLHLSVWALPVLGRVTFWLLLAGIYLFCRRYFMEPVLAVFLVVALTIVKIYANTYPPDFDFNIIPLRLDWWFVLLLLAYWKGKEHWTVGLTLGLLVIFHHVFGTIYAASYVLWLAVLFGLDWSGKKGGFRELFQKHLLTYKANALMIAGAFLAFQLFFAPHKTPLSYFLKLGIAFMPIAGSSFYWYFPVVFSMTLLLLLKNRTSLAPRYFEAGIFLIILVIGNSIYFLGRSHENNIINIAAGLMMVLFLLVDLCGYVLAESVLPMTWMVPAAGMAIVLVVSFSYAQRAQAVAFFEWANAVHGDVVMPYVRMYDIDVLRRQTFGSPRIVFMSQDDFFYYYEGGYDVPDNFQCNFFSWYLLKDYVNFLNDELNKGYYIVIPKAEVMTNKDIITQLKPAHGGVSADFLILSNNDIGAP